MSKQGKIIIEGLYSTLEVDNLPQALEEQLQDECVWVNPLNLTDYIEFYKEGEMYTGCIYKVKKYLEDCGYTIELVYPVLKKVLNSKFLGTYRPLQESMVDAVLEHRFGLMEAPPRSGKTVCMAAALAIIGLPGLIIVEDTAPYEQAVRTLRELTNMTVGEVKTKNYTLGEVNVVTRQTWMAAIKRGDKELLKILEASQVVFIDEAHNSQGPSYFEILSSMTNIKYLVGWSGTPYTDNDKEEYVFNLVGPVIGRITATEAIDNGLVLPVDIHFESIPKKDYGYTGHNAPKLSAYKRGLAYTKVKTDYILQNQIRADILVQVINEAQAEGLSVGVVIEQLEHGYMMADKVPGSVVIHGQLPRKEREALFTKLKNKEITCAFSTLIDEATDIPTLGCVILAGGGKNKKSLFQRALRSSTAAPGKTRGFIVIPYDQADFLNSHSKTTYEHMKDYARKHPLNRLYMDGKLIKT